MGLARKSSLEHSKFYQFFSRSTYDYGVASGSEQANTTLAVDAVTNLVTSEIIYFTAVENITISNCEITLDEL